MALIEYCIILYVRACKPIELSIHMKGKGNEALSNQTQVCRNVAAHKQRKIMDIKQIIYLLSSQLTTITPRCVIFQEVTVNSRVMATKLQKSLLQWQISTFTTRRTTNNHSMHGRLIRRTLLLKINTAAHLRFAWGHMEKIYAAVPL